MFGAFEAFREKNYSIFFTTRVISATGMWFQTLTLSLVILELTNSAQALSWVTIAHFSPMLFLSVPAGRLTDRISSRTVLLYTSILSAALVTLLAYMLAQKATIITILGVIFALGSVGAFERNAEQTIIYELVGPERLTAGISGNSIATSAARSIGPGLAGITFQAFGATTCLLLNALAFLIVHASLHLIRESRLYERRRAPSKKSATPAERLTLNRNLIILLITTIVISLFSLNFMIVLTAIAAITFKADGAGVGLVHMVNALGALLGGALVGFHRRLSLRVLGFAALILAGALALNAVVPTFALFLAVGPILGIAFAYYQGVLYATAQANVPPEHIGKMMSLVNMGLLGAVPIGAWISGSITEFYGGQTMMMVGASAAFLCALLTFISGLSGFNKRPR